MTSTAFVSRAGAGELHASGWLVLPAGSGAISRLPIWDRDAALFARLSPVAADAWARAQGWALPSCAHYDALYSVAKHVDPVTMPTLAQLAAEKISAANTKAVDAFRNGNMRSLAWCTAHDAEVFARLKAVNWSGEPVANAGKHWADSGLIYGWWRKDGSKIQSASLAHKNSAHTDYATTFHVWRPSLPGDVFDPVKAPEIELIQAKNYTNTTRAKVDWVVLHSTENPIKPGTARNVALWFAGAQAPQASAHYIVGPDTVVQCVRETAVAWAAPGANATGIQIELVGQAHKTDWTRDGDGPQDGLRVVVRAAELTRAICKRWDIPLERVDAAGLLAGKRGITSHAAVGAAFKKSTHVDPGGVGDVRWPWEPFLKLVRG